MSQGKGEGVWKTNSRRGALFSMSNGWVSGFRGLARTSRFLPRRRFALDFGRNDRGRWLGLRPDTAGPLDSRGRLSRHDCGDADEQQVPFDSAQGRLSRAFGALGMTILRMRIQ
jgi:hypothetical protein